MSLAVVFSRAQLGIEAPLITVETHLSNGLPCLNIVGLPETAVKESKDRVRSALLNSHFEFPPRRITINLAPADLPKEGGRYDLAIALGILAASGQLPATALSDHEFVGELALSGELRGIRGCLAAALACGRDKRKLLLPKTNANEAALAEGTRVFGATHLLEVCAHLNGNQAIVQEYSSKQTIDPGYPDLSDIKGQESAKRALQIAAAGSHNLLFIGPPGTGKTMLASRLPGLLPPLSPAETLEVATLQSLIGGAHSGYQQRPFRTPHHTASAVALVGGGSTPKPGEISLAHKGVLFLDELPEFPRKVLDVLREPLESGEICLSRAQAQIRYPARFQLIAAMNPCPCGYHGESNHRCRCTPDQINRYQNRISGPLLDRIDMHVRVPSLPHSKLAQTAGQQQTPAIREKVAACRQTQLDRAGKVNAYLDTREIDRYCALSTEQQKLMEQAMNKLGLSARAWHRILRLARTIADLEQCPVIETHHLIEALAYRQLDRKPLL
ncbi:MAG: YifB family Mg chelatase-like AAA ATPase [Pseudomonadales bacterium]|nr:YifB family Mg chelatase-like AAA ATPase [Pseudomonadales bacterium]